MTKLSWEKIKDLKRPVTQKTMYIGMAIVLVIGILIGYNYTLDDLFHGENAIVESPTFATIGDYITIRCSKGTSNSVCNSEGYLQKGLQTPFMVIWDSGVTTHYTNPLEVNQTFETENKVYHNVTFEDHQDAQRK